jgi:hypothetical protein
MVRTEATMSWSTHWEMMEGGLLDFSSSLPRLKIGTPLGKRVVRDKQDWDDASDSEKRNSDLFPFSAHVTS